MYIINNELNILEDDEYEFKEIRGGNPKGSINSNVAEYATAFLNSQGGRIFYGITDDSKVKGFKANGQQIDEIQRVVYDSLRTIEPTLSADHYTLEFHQVYDTNLEPTTDLYVLEVVVPPSRDKKAIYFNKGKELHIRVRGVKQVLKGTEIVSFIQKKLLE
ncbi:ATP-binding protein [Bacillus cereus group sp. RP32]